MILSYVKKPMFKHSKKRCEALILLGWEGAYN